MTRHWRGGAPIAAKGDEMRLDACRVWPDNNSLVVLDSVQVKVDITKTKQHSCFIMKTT